MMDTSWHSYPSLYALGHRYVSELFLDPVLVEEKVDGSQFSFGIFPTLDGEWDVKARSKGAQLNVFAPEKMFQKAIESVMARKDILQPGWTYRCEYLAKPKHNALCYDRVPKDHLVIFDINRGHEDYLDPVEKKKEADRIGLEIVPVMAAGKIDKADQLLDLLQTISFLGGQKVEGVVVKNYHRFGVDKKILIGKFVSEAFKETHAREWKADNPSKNDVVALLISTLKTDARWHKAVQHLREAGRLDDSPKDIGLLFKEVPNDIRKEEEDFIKEKLFEWAWPHIQRGVMAGLPEWYKEQLMKKQFEVPA
jgi:hypothetical protein